MSLSFLRHAALALVAATAPLFAADAISLFDGKTLDGWEGAEGLWRVEDGAITGESTAEKPLTGNTFLYEILRQRNVQCYGDIFVLRNLPSGYVFRNDFKIL